MKTEPFATARLAMRAVRAGDAEAAYAVFSDAEAMTFWSHPPHDSLEQTAEHLAKRIDSPDWRFWAVTLPADDRLIGTLGAHEGRQGGVFEIGYSLVRDAWGRGYAAEAVGGLVNLLFAEGARRVMADTDPDNAASNRLLERLGFTCEGRLRGEWETHIGVRDSLIWGRLATDPAPDPATRPTVPPRG